MDFDSIYYLHIHKTGGRWLFLKSHEVLKNLIDLNKFKILNPSGTDESHWGWIPEITNKTFIYTSFREPVKQICSLYVHSNNIEKIKLDKNKFFKDLKAYPNLYSNNQSKHLCYNNMNGILNIWAEKCPQPSLELAMKRIKRINCIFLINNNILTKKDLTNKFINKNILDNTDNDILDNTDNKNYLFSNDCSKILYNSLTDEEKEIVRSYSPIDQQVYNYCIEQNE